MNATITTSEFIQFLKSHANEISSSYEIVDFHEDEDGNDIHWGYAWNELYINTTVEGQNRLVELRYARQFSGCKLKPSEWDLDSQNAETEWTVSLPFDVYDAAEDYELDANDIMVLVFDHIHLDDIELMLKKFPDDAVEDVDCDCDNVEDESMEEYIVRRDNDSNLRFFGEYLGGAASSTNDAMGSSYSGNPGRYTELELYRTKGGKYICVRIGRTRYEKERDRFEAVVAESISDVIEFFGYGWLSKELYSDAEIDADTIIE